MDNRLRKALLKSDYKTVAELLNQGTDLGLENYDAGNLPDDRPLTDEEMADYAREQMGASGLPKNAFTLLRRAADANCVELVAILLKRGLDPNRRDEFGNPIWDSVITNNACEVMVFLLNHGLNPQDGFPVKGLKEPYTIMEHAVRRGTPKMVNLLLQQGLRPFILPDESEAEAKILQQAQMAPLKWKVLKGKPTRAEALAFFKGKPKKQSPRKSKKHSRRIKK